MKKMLRGAVAVALLAIILGLSVALVHAADDAGKDNPLKDKDLVKRGNLFLLQDDIDLVNAMKGIRAGHAKLDADQHVRVGIEKQIKMAKAAIGQYDLDRRKLNESLAGNGDPTVQNQIIGRINSDTSKINEAMQFKKDQESKLAAMDGEARAKYVQDVSDDSAKIEKIQKHYADLAADEDVKTTLGAMTPKGKLGPSPEFLAAANQLKKWNGDIASDTIPVQMESHVPNVEVTLNDNVTTSMVFDSGASLVCIPADLAQRLNLVPGPNDPTIQLSLADGKVVEGRQMVLKSVRVGTFKVEQVECAVLPPTLVAAQPLLGGTFLHNFIYRMDADAGQLHMSQIGGTKTVGAVGGDSGKKSADKPADKSGDKSADPKMEKDSK